MPRAWLLLATAVASLACGVGIARSHTVEFDLHATLDSGQEVPKPPHPVARATGTLAGTLDRETRTVEWNLVYKSLSGPPTAAEIRLGRPAAIGPVALALCGPRAPVARTRCRSGVHGVATFGAKTMRALQAGFTYVNVHTSKNPTGEIRGQLLTLR
jgi:CHRD domain